MTEPRAANEAERRRWNDERWTAAWPARESVTGTVTPVLMRALDAEPGERVVDIGCGGGVATLECARVVGVAGTVCGIDLSEALLGLARDRADEAGVRNVSFLIADAQTDEIPGQPFDLAISQFGVMFFDNPPAAFANIRHQLRPGGRFRFACWQAVDRNPWHTARTLSQFVAPPAAPPAGTSQSGPFSLGDASATETLLAGAGFVDIVRRDVEQTVRVVASAVYDPELFEFLGVPLDRRHDAALAIEAHLAQFLTAPGQYELPLAFSIYAAARAPA